MRLPKPSLDLGITHTSFGERRHLFREPNGMTKQCGGPRHCRECNRDADHPVRKALTVYQPWATLIVELAKPYEFRGWKAYAGMVGERIVIHASARPMVRREVEDILYKLLAGGELAAMTCLHARAAIPILERALEEGLPHSAGIGTALMGEPRNGWDIAEEFGLERANDSDRDQHANWGWPMLQAEKWADPVPMKGAQGFWNWPTPEDIGL